MGYVPAKKEVWEVIEAVGEIQERKEKVKYLQDNVSPALKDLLRGTYDDSLKFNLPEGKPPYIANTEESYPSTLHKCHMEFGYFVKGGPGDKLPNYRREQKFINLLEAIHPNDAELVVRMVEKKQLRKGVTKKIIETAFPKLLVK